MILPQLVIKVLLLVPSVIFIFYGAIYALISEINLQPNLTKFYRNASLVLLGGGVLLLVTYIMI
jgi:hypothetical protein